MITRMSIRCQMYGQEFSPNLVEQLTGLVLEDKNEVGELQKRGPFKGKPANFGWGVLCSPTDFEDDDELKWIVSALSKHIEIIRICGAEDIDLVIGAWYDKQCNLVFTAESIKILGELGITIELSCYEA